MRAYPLCRLLLIAIPMIAGCNSLLNRDAKVTDANSKLDKTPDPTTIKPAPAPRINPATHMAAGQMLEKQGDLRGAIEQYEKAVAANPRNPASYNRLGIVYQKLGNVAEAEQMFLRGLEANPKSSMLLNNFGYCLMTQQRYDDAERNLRKAVEVSPDFRRARMNLAISLAHLGRGEESVAQFALVVPKDIACLNLAVIEMQKGDYAASERTLRDALAINPDCPGAKAHLARVAKLAREDGGSDPAKPGSQSLRVAGSGDEEPPAGP